MGIRVTPELRDELVARADAKGRSITQEMELLLEQALLTERALDGKAWQIARDVMREFDRVAHGPGHPRSETDDPLDEPTIFGLGMIYAIESMAAKCPEPHPDHGPRKRFVLNIIDAARRTIEEDLQ